MSAVDSLLSRIEAEFDAVKQRVAQFREEQVEEYKQRQERLKTFEKVCDTLGDVWKPRLEALASRLGERASVTPLVKPELRQATFEVKSPLAKIVLTFSAATDSDVRNLVLRYDLEILPILMKFKETDRLEMPLEKVDPQAVATWIEDRIVDFVKTFLEVHQNRNYAKYLKHYMVVDPVAKVEFPAYAAAATCEWNGQTWHFLGDETLREFKKQHGLAE